MRIHIVAITGLVLAGSSLGCGSNKSAKEEGLDCSKIEEKVRAIAPEQGKQGFAMVYRGSCDNGNLSAKNYKCIMDAKDYDAMKECK